VGWAWSVAALRLHTTGRRPCSTALDQGRRDPLRRAVPIKRLGTNLWAALDFKLFNEGRPGVVLGRDQWLYSDEEFNPSSTKS
jgi:alginate O-acetyltransferase complex protein AlgJ